MIDQTGLPYLRVTAIDPTNGGSVPFSRVALIDPNTGAFIGSTGHPGYPVGAGTFPMWSGPVAGQGVGAVDTLYLYPFELQRAITFTAGQLRVTVAGTASSAKTAIWANGLNTTQSAYRPLGAPLIVDNTGVSTAATGNTAVSMAGTLQPGIIWIGTKHTGTLPQLTSIVGPNTYAASLVGVAGSALISSGFTFPDAYANAMPTFTTSSVFSLHGGSVPILGLTT